MSDQSSQFFYQNPNNKAKATYVQDWTAGDRWVFVITLTATFTSWFAVEADQLHWGWAVLISFVSVVLNIHIEYARMYAELWQLLKSAYIAIVLKDVLWQADESDRRWVEFLRNRRYRRDEDRRARIPLSLNAVEATVDGCTERYCILNELDTDWGYLYVRAEGSAYGDLDLEDQQRVHEDLSRAINSFFGSYDKNVGVTQLRVVRPADLTSIDHMISRAGDPFMFYSDGLPREIDPKERKFNLDPRQQAWAEFRSRNFDQLKPTARAMHVAREWEVLVISFTWKSIIKRAASGKLDEKQIGDQPLIDLGRTLTQEIASISLLELQNPHVMSPVEAAEFVRASFGVELRDIEQYYAAKSRGDIVSSGDDLQVVTREIVEHNPEKYKASDVGMILTDLQMWPRKKIIVKSDRILVDDTWFMPVRFDQTPEVEHPTRAQAVHFATPPGSWSSFAAVSVRSRGNIDTNVLMSKETARRSFEEYRSRGKMMVHPKYRRRQKLADMSLEQVSLASTNQRYLPICVLTAPADSPDLLDKRFAAYRLAMKNQGIKVVKIKGRVRMLDALITGILGINRL